jgi:hypothetical protein
MKNCLIRSLKLQQKALNQNHVILLLNRDIIVKGIYASDYYASIMMHVHVHCWYQIKALNLCWVRVLWILMVQHFPTYIQFLIALKIYSTNSSILLNHESAKNRNV